MSWTLVGLLPCLCFASPPTAPPQPTVIRQSKTTSALSTTATSDCGTGYIILDCQCFSSSLARCRDAIVSVPEQRCQVTGSASLTGGVTAVATCAQLDTFPPFTDHLTVQSEATGTQTGAMSSVDCPLGYLMTGCGGSGGGTDMGGSWITDDGSCVAMLGEGNGARTAYAVAVCFEGLNAQVQVIQSAVHTQSSDMTQNCPTDEIATSCGRQTPTYNVRGVSEVDTAGCVYEKRDAGAFTAFVACLHFQSDCSPLYPPASGDMSCPDGFAPGAVCHFSCHAGYEPQGWSRTCDDVWVGPDNTCNDVDECDDPASCGSAMCNNLPGSYWCSCPSGFTFNEGTRVCDDNDECQTAHDCVALATCVNRVGSYDCNCPSGYEGDGRVSCDDADQCTPDPCHVNAQCTDFVGSYTCECDSGFTGDGTQCEDVDECVERECGPFSDCANLFGTSACTPTITGLRLAGTPGTETALGILLNSVVTGQIIQLELDLPPETTIDFSSQTVFFGPPSSLSDFACSSITVNASEPSPFITCVLGVGAGQGLIMSMAYCFDYDPPPSPRCRVMVSNETLSYPAPTIDKGTLNSVGSTSGSRTVQGDGSVILEANGDPGGETLSTSGSNFAGYQLQIFLGPPGDERRFQCAWVSAQSNSSFLTFRTQPGASGQGLLFTVVVGQGEAEMVATSIDSYNITTRVPSVEAVTCSPALAPNGTCMFSTEGGQEVTIVGDQLGEGINIFVASQFCPLVGSPTEISAVCLLPPGSGSNLGLIVVAPDGAVSQSRPLVHYQPPVIVSLAAFACASGNSSAELIECNRQGGGRITIDGRNFDATGAHVVIGATECQNLQHEVVAGSTHRRVTCDILPGTELQVPLFVSNQGGGFGLPAFVSYSQCRSGWTSHEGAACEPCPPGRFSETSGQDVCLACPAGRVSKLVGQIECEDCKAGTHQASESQAECIPCGNGTFAGVGARACAVCPAGRYAAAADTGCQPCGPGRFQARNQSWRCNLCPVGTYQPGAEALSCLECPVGKVGEYEGSAQCARCREGHYMDQPQSRSCLPCPPGTIAARAEASGCSACPVGSSNHLPGQSKCTSCPAGSAQNLTGSTECAPCAEGTHAPSTGLNLCLPCGQGSFALKAAVSCTLCEEGRYQGAVLSRQCDACAAGRYSTSRGQTTCFDCAVGRFQNETQGKECQLCPTGTSQFLRGRTRCEPCAVGTQMPSVGSSACRPCGVNAIAPHTGMPECELCLQGRANQFATACDCEAGYFWNAHATGGVCVLCPLGSVCDVPGVTRSTLKTRPGFWRRRTLGDEGGNQTGWSGDVIWEQMLFHRCIQRQHCVGGVQSSCGVNRMGPLCARCLAQHSLANGVCEKCPGADSALGLSAVFISITLVALVIVFRLFLYLDARAIPKRHKHAKRKQQKSIIKASLLSHSPSSSRASPSIRSRRSMMRASGRAKPMNRRLSPELTVVPGSPASRQRRRVHRQDNKEDKRNDNCDLAAEAAPREPAWKADEIPEPDSPDSFKRQLDLRASLTVLKAGIQPTVEARVGNQYQVKVPQKAANSVSALKVLMLSTQILTTVSLLREVPWPIGFASFMKALKFINLDFVPFESLTCITGFDFYTKLFFATLTPPGLLLLLLLFFLVPSLIVDRWDMADHDVYRERARITRLNFWKLCAFSLFLLYPLVSSSLLGVFACHRVGDVSYLLLDFDQVCYNAKWTSYLPYIVSLMVVYIVGTPVLLGFALYRFRSTADSPVAFLMSYYEITLFWFELGEMVHKLFLTSILSLLPPFVQLPAAMIAACIFIVILLLLNPYLSPKDDLFRLLAQVEMLMIFSFGMLIYTLDESLPLVMDHLLSALLISMFCVLVVTFVLYVVRSVRHVAQKRRRKHDVAEFDNKLDMSLLEIAKARQHSVKGLDPFTRRNPQQAKTSVYAMNIEVSRKSSSTGAGNSLQQFSRRRSSESAHLPRVSRSICPPPPNDSDDSDSEDKPPAAEATPPPRMPRLAVPVPAPTRQPPPPTRRPPPTPAHREKISL